MTTTAQRGERIDEDDVAPSRIPHRKLILAAIAIVVLAAVGTWVVAFSSVFGVRTVDVRGTHRLSTTQIRAAAEVADGTPLVRLDTDAIRTRVERLPDVASVTVTTSFPSTVVITVSERAPIGVVHVGNEYRLVDRTGDQYRAVHKRPAHLPLFVVSKGSAARATGGAVATVASALPEQLRARIDSIQALDPQAITLLLKDGRLVHWGSAAQSAEKARVLPTLLKQPGTQIDVTDPAQPFTR